MTDLMTLISPLPKTSVRPIVETYAESFSKVLIDALDAYRHASQSAPEEFAQLGGGARGLLVADLTRQPALRIFGSVPGAEVNLRHGYPWVSLHQGKIQVRFKKLGRDLSICLTDTERSKLLAYHLGDPCLPGFEPATVLTAGYVMDDSGLAAERLAVVCHVGTAVNYSFDLPMDATAPARRPEQLPAIPLSAPLIRSAQRSAAQRINDLRAGS